MFRPNLNLDFILLVLTFSCEILSSEVPRPRGVSLSRAALYIPDQDFQCFDGSKKIPFKQVNDDYCDCLDGSDEPGTSACLNGIFHCTNAGHKPQNLGSSRVNDGICDCCDGTDEYSSGKTCPNICLELGRAAREEAQRLAELIKAGKELKAELSQKGIQLKQEKNLKLAELEKNKEEAIKVKAEKEKLKIEIEEQETKALEYYRQLEEEERKKKAEAEKAKDRAEATEIFIKFDSNQDGIIDIAEIQVRQTFDKDKNGEVSEEEAKYFLDNKDFADKETFIENCWQFIKPYILMDSGLFKPPQTETQSEAADMGEEEHEEDEHADEDEEEANDEEEEPTEEPHDEPSTVEYDDQTKALVEKASVARSEFSDAEKAVRDIDNEIKQIKEYLEKDFGPEEEFATLAGQCFEYRDHEYIYTLCPFDKTTQQQISGSSETRLGSWGKWSGPEGNKYSSMHYDRGQSCWNGPQRSTSVTITCASENKVTSVSEPNRCEYHFEFTTPAACRELPSDVNEDIHDEL